MNRMETVTPQRAERAGRRPAPGLPWPTQNHQICTVAGLLELDWTADHIGGYRVAHTDSPVASRDGDCAAQLPSRSLHSQVVSEIGSEMGVAIRPRHGQTRSGAVIVAVSVALTCSNVIKQRLCSPGRSVRDEEHPGCAA
jgi:hypothetical protein